MTKFYCDYCGKPAPDRNFPGVQLDLIRDELLRISARIGETGLLNEHPGLRSIFDYCERAQKDISVNYTPIQERDAWKEKASQLERERDEARAALNEANSKIEHMMGHCGDCECRICAEIVCKHHDPLHFHHDGCPTCENPPTATQIGEAWLRDSSLEKWFPITAETLAQAIADRDAWKAKAERTCKWSTREWSEFCQTECGESFPIPRQDKYKCCPSCGGRIVKE